MPLDAKWPHKIQNVVVIENLKKMTVILFSKSVTGNFLPHFDDCFEEHPTFFA
jgi:hypothetical protein